MSQEALEVVVMLASVCSFAWLAWALWETAKMEYKHWQWKRTEKQKELIRNTVNHDIAEVGNLALEAKQRCVFLQGVLDQQMTPAQRKLLKKVSKRK